MSTLSKRELDIANQIKAQGGTREDFENVLRQVRKEKPELFEAKEEVKVEETPEETKVTQTQSFAEPQEKFLTIDEIGRIGKEAQEREARKQEGIEQEKEEGLKGFVSEAKEALGRRGENISDIKQRFDAKIQENQAKLREAVERDDKNGLVQAMKNQFTIMGSAFQAAGQVVGTGVDIAWEGIENLIQDATPEVAEDVIESAIAKIGESETVQSIAESYMDFRENNPETARNIEASVNIGQIFPVTKGLKLVTPTSKKVVRETAKQSLKDSGRAFLNLPGKTTPTKTLELSKFFADRVKPTNSFDDLVKEFDDIASKAINQVDNSLKKSTTLHKPQGAKEVLQAIKNNLKNIEFSTNQKKVVDDLLKKFNKEGLTLTDLNKIKRSINDYTKAWTASGREAAGLNPAAMRGKYTEIKKFIENVASRENLGDIKALNQEWINSNELMEHLGKQATKIGKKKGVEALQKQGFIKRLGTKVRQFREDIGFSDAPGAQSLEDLDLSQAIKAIQKLSGKTEQKSVLEKLGTGLNKATKK